MKKLKTPRLLAGIMLVLALSISLGGCGSGVAQVGAQAVKVVSVAATITNTLSDAANIISIVADVVSGEPLKEVIAKVFRPNQTQPIEVTLTRNSDGKYEGAISVGNAATMDYTATVEATNTTGDSASSELVKVEAAAQTPAGG